MTGHTEEHGFQFLMGGSLGVVTVPEDLGDWNAQQFLETLAFAAGRAPIIAVDLSRTRQCEPRALVALLMALKYTDRAGGEIRVVLGPAQTIRRAFFDSGMHRLFRNYDSVTAALHAELPATAAPRSTRTVPRGRTDPGQ